MSIEDVALPTSTEIEADQTFEDGIRLLFGTDEDVIRVFDSPGRAANAAYAGVLAGTPVYAKAIPANSLIESNITADGDFVWYTNTGGNSIEAMRIDASARSVVFPQDNDPVTPTLAFHDGGDGFYSNASDQITVAIAGIGEINITNQEIRGGGINNFSIRHSKVVGGGEPFYTIRGDENTGMGSEGSDILSFFAGAFEIMRLTENLVADDESAITMAGPTKTTTSDATTSGRILDILARTYNWDGGVNITTPIDGIGLRMLAPVIASDSAMVITQLSTLYVAAPDVSDAEVTATLLLAAEFDGGVLMTGARFLETQGADVASTNNLVLGIDGNSFEITGTTDIN
ncbi:hypothetical protein LCGC14_2405980, partial [marine sediment metagenome]